MKQKVLDRIKSTAQTVQSAANNAGINKENLGEKAMQLRDSAKKLKDSEMVQSVGQSLTKVGDKAIEKGSGVVQKVKEIEISNYQIDAEDMLKQLIKVPGVRVDRESFLRKELTPHFSKPIVGKAIEYNPAYAGIERKKIDEITSQVIDYETNRVSAISFAAGLPGGFAMFATIPADVTQYFANIVIATQKIAYLYGFEDFELNDAEMSDNALNEIMVFLGVMFGVQQANQAVKFIAQSATQKVAKTLSQKALTKTTVYPIVKSVAKVVGIKMTKEIFAKNVSKVVPIVGGVVSGGLTYATFKPGCNRLKNNFSSLNLSDPEFYKDIIDVEVV